MYIATKVCKLINKVKLYNVRICAKCLVILLGTFIKSLTCIEVIKKLRAFKIQHIVSSRRRSYVHRNASLLGFYLMCRSLQNLLPKFYLIFLFVLHRNCQCDPGKVIPLQTLYQKMSIGKALPIERYIFTGLKMKLEALQAKIKNCHMIFLGHRFCELVFTSQDDLRAILATGSWNLQPEILRMPLWT